jgi:hypothetical protein
MPLSAPQSAPLDEPESAPLLDPEPPPLLDPESAPLLDPEPPPLLDPEPLPLLDPEPLPLLDPEPLPLLDPEPLPLLDPEPLPLLDPALSLLVVPSSLPPSSPVGPALAPEPPQPAISPPARIHTTIGVNSRFTWIPPPVTLRVRSDAIRYPTSQDTLGGISLSHAVRHSLPRVDLGRVTHTAHSLPKVD